MTDNELLKYAIENGIINTALLQEKVDMQKKKAILDKHTYKIYQGNDGKWYTYLPYDNGRKKIKAITEEKLLDKVVSFYEERAEKEEKVTVEEIFQRWSSWKLTNKDVSKQTIDRYTIDFDKYFADIKDVDIKGIQDEFMEDFIDKCIAKHDMTAKQFTNFRTVLYGIFKYAKKKKIITFSIAELLSDMEISPKRFKKVAKNPIDQVYGVEEKDKMETYLMENMDIFNLGLLLLFKTGLRIGELAALKREDVQEYTIYINRTEVRYKNEDDEVMYEVRDFPKSDAGCRFSVIPYQYEWILDKILECGGKEYLFEKNGKRIKTYSFRRRLRYICESKIGMKSKSPHKVRKTYGTILLDGKVRDSTILDSMGHVDLNCTRGHYYFNRSSIEDKRKELSLVNGL